MREILFRGKAVNLNNGSKDFVYGQYVQNRDGKMIYSDTWEDGIQKHYVIEKTVGQYTGLTDRNGKKIFVVGVFLSQIKPTTQPREAVRKMYKNPIPVLPEDEKYKEFRIQFKYKEAMTTKEVAQEFFAYLMDKGELPEKFVAPIGKAILEYQK